MSSNRHEKITFEGVQNFIHFFAIYLLFAATASSQSVHCSNMKTTALRK